jgi:DHA1 family inner membrane transport protein
MHQTAISEDVPLATEGHDSQSSGKLYSICLLLALGQFALVTSVWMLIGVLQPMADDFSISIGAAGQVISIFSITYAVAGPLLAVATGRVDRRRLLIASLLIFALANLFSAWSADFGLLLIGRAVAAAADGLYAATATAVVAMLAPANRRGRAIALLNTGFTVALCIGVPLSTLIGVEFGWRGTFIGVAAAAGIAILGLFFLLPRIQNQGVPTLKQRIAVLKAPRVLPTLGVTTFSYLGMFTVYAYLAPILAKTANVSATAMSGVILGWGIAAVAGNYVGGYVSDRLGPVKVLMFSLTLAIPLLVALPLLAGSLLSATILVFAWGGLHYAGFPALQLRITTLAPGNEGVALALNNSAVYLGIACGAIVGGFALNSLPIATVGLVGALIKTLGLILLLRSSRGD